MPAGLETPIFCLRRPTARSFGGPARGPLPYSLAMQETFIDIKSLDSDARGVGHLDNEIDMDEFERFSCGIA